jgi:glutaredoxin 3
MPQTYPDNVVIYSQNNCPACTTAKQLLTSQGRTYTEYNISTDAHAKATLFVAAPSVRSVPQIFINGKHIGNVEMLQKYLNRK